MKKGGGKMAAAAIKAVEDEKVFEMLRPPPDKVLDAYGKKVWKDTVARMPPGWFSIEQLPALKTYCEAFSRINKIEKEIKKRKWDYLDTKDMVAYKRLEVLIYNLTNVTMKLANSLRISKQTQVSKSKAQTETTKQEVASVAKKPWEV